MHRIDAFRFGIAGGLFYGFFCFAFTLLATLNGYGSAALKILESIFVGYDISVTGSLIGGLYGIIFGFVELFTIAFIYNMLGPPRE